MASAISSIVGSTPTAGATSSAAAASSASAPTEQMFLQLLVAQIQNQDPLNPADGMQFVTQLAQFSELEQVMGIRQDIETDFSPAKRRRGRHIGFHQRVPHRLQRRLPRRPPPRLYPHDGKFQQLRNEG